MAYNRTEAVDMRRAQYGTAAPKRKPQQRRQAMQQPQVVKKTRSQIRAEERRSTIKTLKVMAVCAAMFTLVFFQIYSQVQVDELDRQLNDINSEIEIVEAENTRLNMQLDSVISLEKVDDYAQNVLGMVKAENYQVSYIDLSSGDTVTKSGGKVKRSLWENIKIHF